MRLLGGATVHTVLISRAFLVVVVVVVCVCVCVCMRAALCMGPLSLPLV